MVEFRLLGPLEALGDDGRAIPLGGQKQRALLALLLLNAGRVVSTDRLLDELWNGRPPRTAATSLQNMISGLRRLLGREHVVTRPPGYVLDVDPRQTDVGRLQLLIEEAKRAGPERRSEAVREALALWRGEPLAEFADEAFAQPEIARLEELRCALLETRIDADLALRHDEALVGELEGLVARFPLRERLRGQLMLALYRSGRQVEALTAYRNARQTLVDELGIEPGPALQRLHAAILRQEAGLEPSADDGGGDDHLAEVVRALDGGRVVLVLGAGANAAPVGNGSPPDDAALAARLASCFGCPPEHRGDLARVAQYVAMTAGVGPLYDELHAALAGDFEPGEVQRTLARLPATLRARGAAQPVLVSTTYDRALERAFADEGEELDVVSYLALGRHRGKFLHVPADGQPVVIDLPNAYAELPLGRRTVLLKVHGGVDPDGHLGESFVVSEDDYIGYLSPGDAGGELPVTLAAKLRRSHFLFLGYGVLAWNLRVFLHRVFGEESPAYRSWAVQPKPQVAERDFWRHRGIDLYDAPLEAYLGRLAERLAREPVAEVVA
ncbi:MAG TPA: BTAD domain-containing putative transcriptional regulator [Gaiellaceae bacterium]|nr:BTAD domain-containing putative transcriptional regulator [Gaiellaceae bacterium]